MKSKPVAREDWKTVDMPEARAELEVERAFSSEEMKRIKLGLIPDEMEDKWFIYYQEDRLYFHRSWTGQCIYIVEFERRGKRSAISRVWVNRDKSHYTEDDDAFDARQLLFLIDLLLLGQKPVFPIHHENESPEEQALRIWAIVGRAMSGVSPDVGKE